MIKYFISQMTYSPYLTSLEEIENSKIERGQKIEQYFWEKNDDPLKMEKKLKKKHLGWCFTTRF